MRPSEPEDLIRVARQTALVIATSLKERLVSVYGGNWIVTVNERRRYEGRSLIESLSDPRACLAVFAYDPAIEGWAPEDLRRKARKLIGLANSAHHNRPLTVNDLADAESILETFRRNYGSFPSPQRSQATRPRASRHADTRPHQMQDSQVGAISSRGTDIQVPMLLTGQEASRGCTKEITVDFDRPWDSVATVRFPPNLIDGANLRIEGKGMPGKNGGPPGDLIIRILVERDGHR